MIIVARQSFANFHTCTNFCVNFFSFEESFYVNFSLEKDIYTGFKVTNLHEYDQTNLVHRE